MQLTNFLYRLLNTSQHEIGRVSKMWVLHFFYSLGFFLVWTVVIALFIDSFGAISIPFLYISHALFSVLGAGLYSFFNYRFDLKYLMIGTGVLLLLSLFASMHFINSKIVFFGFLLATIGIFIWQIQIFLARYKEELFTPLESPRVLPLIETTEPLGGIGAGILILLFINHIHAESFLFFVAAIFLIFIILFFFFDISKHRTPQLKRTDASEGSIISIKRGIEHLKTIPFMRGMALLTLCWIIAFIIIEIQYTRAIEELVHHSESHTESTYHAETKYGDSHTEDGYEDKSHSDHAEKDTHASSSSHQDDHGTEHKSHLGDLLFERLGSFQILFSFLMLMMQLFLTSRIVRHLGIIKSFFFLPIATFLTTLGAIFAPGITFFASMKGSIESFGVLHKTAYHNSYYSLTENMREHIRQILEGVFRPFGVVIGTLLIIGTQYVFPTSYEKIINLLLLAVFLIMLLIILRFPKQYGAILKKNLSMHKDHDLKHNAIDILAQKSHKDAPEILSKALIYKKEDSHVKIKILRSLGALKDPNSLPEILHCLKDDNLEVRLAACHALAEFKDLGNHVFSQAFSKHKIVTTLSEMLKTEDSKRLRSAIVHVFSNIQHRDVAPLLIDTLETAEDDEMIAHCIFAIGLFKDINIWHYLSPYLTSQNPRIKSNAIIALWKFKKYRLQLLIHLLSLLDSKEKDSILSGVYAVGEIRAIQELSRLKKLLHHDDPDIVRHTGIALLKMDQRESLPVLLSLLLEKDDDMAYKTLKLLDDVENRTAQGLRRNLKIEVSHHMHELAEKEQIHETSLKDLSAPVLKKLLRYYTILGEDKEIYKIKDILEQK